MVSAFNTLSPCRTSNGFGRNPISFTDIRSYIELFGHPFSEAKDFVDLLSMMDGKFLELHKD